MVTIRQGEKVGMIMVMVMIIKTGVLYAGWSQQKDRAASPQYSLPSSTKTVYKVRVMKNCCEGMFNIKGKTIDLFNMIFNFKTVTL